MAYVTTNKLYPPRLKFVTLRPRCAFIRGVCYLCSPPLSVHFQFSSVTVNESDARFTPSFLPSPLLCRVLLFEATSKARRMWRIDFELPNYTPPFPRRRRSGNSTCTYVSILDTLPKRSFSIENYCGQEAPSLLISIAESAV